MKELKKGQIVRIVSSPRVESKRFIGRVGVVLDRTAPDALNQVQFNPVETIWVLPEMCELVAEATEPDVREEWRSVRTCGSMLCDAAVILMCSIGLALLGRVKRRLGWQ